MNDNPRVVAAVVAGLVVLAIVVAAFSSGSSEDAAAPPRAGKEFFSVDDGKNWFVDDAGKMPPFDHQGKPAYRVQVYRCPHGKDFVSHLERYADADRAKLQELLDDADEDRGPPLEARRLMEAVEVKKPGQAAWVKRTPANARAVRAIQSPVCPDGRAPAVQRVLPG